MSAKLLKLFKAVFLVNHTKGTIMPHKMAVKYIRKSKAFFKKWVKRYVEVGNVDDQPKWGLDRTTTNKDTAIAKECRENANHLPEILSEVYRRVF